MQIVALDVPSALGEVLGRKVAERQTTMQDVILEYINKGLEADRGHLPPEAARK